MNTTPANAETADELDRLLSDFFKAELKTPWPKAPTPAAAATEPSELAATRAAEAPRNVPTPTGRDNTARARFTLAASVALMLGTCWYMSNGFAPGGHPGQPTPTPPGPGMLPDGGAQGGKGDALDQMNKNKAIDDGAPKIDMSKGE
jgi:hypothetical protein